MSTNPNYRLIKANRGLAVVPSDQNNVSFVAPTNANEPQGEELWTLTAFSNGAYVLRNPSGNKYPSGGRRKETDVQQWVLMENQPQASLASVITEIKSLWSQKEGSHTSGSVSIPEDQYQPALPAQPVHFSPPAFAPPVHAGIHFPTPQPAPRTMVPEKALSGPVGLHPCSSIHRRAGVSIDRLILAPMADVHALPYYIWLMSPEDERKDEEALIQLRIVATLRNSICNMPSVFHPSTNGGFWDQLAPVFARIDSRWNWANVLQGLVELASLVPGPATIKFDAIPWSAMEKIQAVEVGGAAINTRAWAERTQCLAVYALMILRALPEHNCAAMASI